MLQSFESRTPGMVLTGGVSSFYTGSGLFFEIDLR